MKKIWILEKPADRDEMRKSYDDMKALLEEFKKREEQMRSKLRTLGRFFLRKRKR